LENITPLALPSGTRQEDEPQAKTETLAHVLRTQPALALNASLTDVQYRPLLPSDLVADPERI